jgi:hypothetical protein
MTINKIFVKSYKLLSILFLFAISACTNRQENQNMTAADILVSPNPASTNVFVRYNIGNDGMFSIISKSGQNILSKKLPKGNCKISIPVDSIPTDNYFYIISILPLDTAIGKLYISH